MQKSHLIMALWELVDTLRISLIKKVSFGIHDVNCLASHTFI